MQREAEEEAKGIERSLKEMEGKVRNADVVKELAMVELREALLKEKDQEIENVSSLYTSMTLVRAQFYSTA